MNKMDIVLDFLKFQGGLSFGDHDTVEDGLEAGKVLGEGSQGCIFYPAIFGPAPKSHVTKIAASEDAYQEEAVSRKFQRADPRDRYGIYPKSVVQCSVANLRIKKDLQQYLNARGRGSEACASLARNPEKYCAVNYPKYQQDLDAPVRMSKKLLLESFVNLCDGLVVFHSSNLIHGDIKEANVALQDKTFKFADFGFACDLTVQKDFEAIFKKMHSDRRYTPEQYGGDFGIRTPLIWYAKSPQDKRQVLKFNDVFMLAFLIIHVIGVYTDSHPVKEGAFANVLAVCTQVFKAGGPPKTRTGFAQAMAFTAKAFRDMFVAGTRKDL